MRDNEKIARATLERINRSSKNKYTLSQWSDRIHLERTYPETTGVSMIEATSTWPEMRTLLAAIENYLYAESK